MKWTWDYEAFGEILRGPEMRGHLVEKVEQVKAAAEAIAPVGDPAVDEHPGLYKASFGVDDGVMTTVMGTRTGFARLTNHAPYAAAVEYGNGRVPPHHTMARALDLAAGS